MVEGASTERLALGIYETTPHGTVCYDYTVHALWTTITGRRCPRVVRGYRRTPHPVRNVRQSVFGLHSHSPVPTEKY